MPNVKPSMQIFADALEFMLPISEDEKINDIWNVKFKQLIFSKEGTDKFMECVNQLLTIEKTLWEQQKQDFYIHIDFPVVKN